MSTGTLVATQISDATDLLQVLASVAGSIDFTSSVANATSPSGAVAISQVTGLSQLAAIEAAMAQLPVLVSTPATLASTLVGLVQGFAGTGVDFRELADLAAAITWSTNWRWDGIYADQTAINRDALQTLVVTQAVIEAVRAASSTIFDSQDAAFALGNDLAARIDLAMEGSPSRSARSALRALKTALIADINTRAARLDALRSWVNPGTVPALVLAARIYDDPTMAADIAARNGIEAPLFVAAGTLTILAPDAAS